MKNNYAKKPDPEKPINESSQWAQSKSPGEYRTGAYGHNVRYACVSAPEVIRPRRPGNVGSEAEKARVR